MMFLEYLAAVVFSIYLISVCKKLITDKKEPFHTFIRSTHLKMLA